MQRMAVAICCIVLSSGGTDATASSREIAAAQVQDPSEPVVLPTLDVYGRPLRDAARAFVDTVAIAPAGTRLARWHDPICVSVAGLASPYGQALVDHISGVARDLGVAAGEPGCEANILIIATSDGPGLTEHLLQHHGRRLRPPFDNATLGTAALEKFRLSEAPVRWWHVSLGMNATTGAVAARRRGGGVPGFAEAAIGSIPSETGALSPSRLRSPVRFELNFVAVVLDLSVADGVNVNALGDYLAMVVLAQIDPEADFSGQSTVLNLFSNAGVDGLTDWDRDYLAALYGSRTDRPSASSQEHEVSEQLLRNRLARLSIGREPQGEENPAENE